MTESGARIAIDAEQHRLTLTGDWTTATLPDRAALLRDVDEVAGNWEIDVAAVDHWDSRLSALLLRLHRLLAARGDALELVGADDAQQRLLELATAVPRHEQPVPGHRRLFSLAVLRRCLHDIGDGLLESLAFLGDAVRALLVTLTGRGSLRGRELIGACFQAGPNALGIIALTSVLVGMILA